MSYKIKNGKVVRKWHVGMRVEAVTYGATDPETGEKFVAWFELPEGMTREEAFATQHHYGPFATEQEARESQRIELMGEQCEVREGGNWDPAWDRPQ